VKRQRCTVAPSHAASISSHCSRNPELEQLVCLVQHQVCERRERQRPLAQQRHQPQPQRAHHHVVPAPHAAGRAAAVRAADATTAAAAAAALGVSARGRRELLGEQRRASW
jgi:hypothetical protein